MRYIEEFRDQTLARQLAQAIRGEAQPGREYRLMEFCGGHTHAIFRYGVQTLLPNRVRFIHGPGCPVCVLPAGRIAMALQLLRDHNPILCSYADLMRVPTADRQSLFKAKAEGFDVRMVYSTQDALAIARDNPRREVVFFAIGFETTTPPSAVVIREARQEGLDNFSLFSNHVLTPPAMRAILQDRDNRIDGLLGPSHVSAIIGTRPYEAIVQGYGRPVVIAGFEPLDVMQSTLMLLRQLNTGRCEVENEYKRAVAVEGNRKAQALVDEVFELREQFEWRGLGTVAKSALKVRDAFSAFDAEVKFGMAPISSEEIKGCDCPAVLRGVKRPTECKLFGRACTPESPLGACMVSSEGACAAYWRYGRSAA